MNEVFAAAADLQRFCEAHGWKFCFIGGVALQRWSVPRVTEDVDITLMSRFVHDEEYSRELLRAFEGRREDAFEFAQRARVLLLRHPSGVEMDIGLGAVDFEGRAVERASYWNAPTGDRLLTCSAEDLIVHKSFASRDQDWADVEKIIRVQAERLNLPQIFQELRPLAQLKEEDGIVTQLEWRMKKRGLL